MHYLPASIQQESGHSLAKCFWLRLSSGAIIQVLSRAQAKSTSNLVLALGRPCVLLSTDVSSLSHWLSGLLTAGWLAWSRKEPDSEGKAHMETHIHSEIISCHLYCGSLYLGADDPRLSHPAGTGLRGL